ncbi:MAG: hypothetical protein OEY22_10385 [Candidatus Bathyarchaeota archaeon]|nr:hypothetical protein [Candidatus Bathyarchaeota archaeon]MDH5787766.1 hypothetical protein [Candidatus Bathyarchaeota archaeon]
MAHSDGKPIDYEHEKAALLEIHNEDRQAHFATDVESLLESVHEPHIYVREGEIQHLSRSDLEKTFREYFRDTTFLEWDDMEEPIVNVSEDGTMGWMVERLKVRRIIRSEGGKAEERQFIYAGITVYEKRDDTWLKVANASTFK